MDHAYLLDKIIAWAEKEENVLALVLTGSRARGEGEADEFSDYDIEIIAKDYKKLAGDDAWIHALGTVMVSQYFDEGQEYPTRLVFYEGAEKVDFTLADRRHVEDLVLAGRLVNPLYRRGYKVLVDKDGLSRNVPKAAGHAPQRAKPSQEELMAVVQEFWFEAAHMPKYLARQELWVVKFRDWTMKEMLLKMLEWHALAKNDLAVDVWHIGTKMKAWTDEETWRELQDVFGRFDAEDSWRSLFATMTLFQRLTQETTAAWGMDYDDSVEKDVSAYIRKEHDRRAPGQ